MTLEEQLTLDDGHRFQKKLGELIAEKGFTKVIETGSGVSSIYILQAFNDTGLNGRLYSIDPAMWYPHTIYHDKFIYIKSKSVDAIIPLYLAVGAFDLAISDGNHEILCQTYEYEMMWQILTPGGYLVADDVGWNNNGAWQSFLERHSLKEEHFGDARCVQKPSEIIPIGVEIVFSSGDISETLNKDAVIEFHEKWLSHCEELEKEWLAAGNKKHPAFK